MRRHVFPLGAFEMTLLALALLVPATLVLFAFVVGRAAYRRLLVATAAAMAMAA